MIDRIDKIHVYRGEDGLRWRRVDADNGSETGASTQGYSDARDLLHNIETTCGGEYEIVYDD